MFVLESDDGRLEETVKVNEVDVADCTTNTPSNPGLFAPLIDTTSPAW